jgi:hypothetical protein
MRIFLFLFGIATVAIFGFGADLVVTSQSLLYKFCGVAFVLIGCLWAWFIRIMLDIAKLNRSTQANLAQTRRNLDWLRNNHYR